MNSSKFIVLNLLVAASVAAIAAPSDTPPEVQQHNPRIGEPYGVDDNTGSSRFLIADKTERQTVSERRESALGEPYRMKDYFVSTKTRAEVKEELRVAQARGEVSLGEPYPIKW